MIPKIIHYSWLSGEEMPELYKNCIETWKKYLPDYEIKIWDGNNEEIINIPFVKRCIERRNWAFASDYIRAYALYNYGGIYMDADVEVYKSFNNLLNFEYVCGLEWFRKKRNAFEYGFETAILMFEKQHPIIKEWLDLYNNYYINSKEIYIAPLVFRQAISKHKTYIDIISSAKFNSGIKVNYSEDNAFYVFDKEFFSPIDYNTKTSIRNANTYTCHHMISGWVSEKNKDYEVDLINGKVIMS